MPYTPNYAAGDVLTAAQMNSIGEAWSTYGSTASFTAVSGGLNLGSGGSWSAYYCQVNKIVFVRGRITWGSTSRNLGSGAYRIALPVTAKSTAAGNTFGYGYCLQGSAAKPAFILAPNTSNVAIYSFDFTLGALSEVTSSTAPFTFGNGDIIDFNFCYEAA